MKWNKTKELAEILSSISDELRGIGGGGEFVRVKNSLKNGLSFSKKRYKFVFTDKGKDKMEFYIDVKTLKTKIIDFYTEIDDNILCCNNDLILSRFNRIFIYYEPANLVLFEDTEAEMLSVYNEFLLKLERLMTDEGLNEYRGMLNGIDTTELLSKNLTDFLDEIKQDLETGKYGCKLSDGVFAQTDIYEFLKRISNNFDLKQVLIVCDDIDEWECSIHTDEQPLIIGQIREALNTKTYSHVINETLLQLKNNHNFKNEYIERLRNSLKWNESLLSNIISGYDDAFDEFEKNKTTNQPPPQPDTPIIPDEVLQFLKNTICSNKTPFIKYTSTGKLRWLQNLQNARVLLTHNNIRGNLSIEEAARKAPSIFVNKKDNPLKLAKEDKRQVNTDTDTLIAFLDSIKNTVT